MDVFWSKVRNIQIPFIKLHHVTEEDANTGLKYMPPISHPHILSAFASDRQKIVNDILKSSNTQAHGSSDNNLDAVWQIAPQPATQTAEERKKLKRRPEKSGTISLPAVEKLNIDEETKPTSKTYQAAELHHY